MSATGTRRTVVRFLIVLLLPPALYLSAVVATALLAGRGEVEGLQGAFGLFVLLWLGGLAVVVVAALHRVHWLFATAVAALVVILAFHAMTIAALMVFCSLDLGCL